MVLANGLAIIVGKFLGKQLQEKTNKYATAVIFIASVVLAIYQAVHQRHISLI